MHTWNITHDRHNISPFWNCWETTRLLNIRNLSHISSISYFPDFSWPCNGDILILMLRRKALNYLDYALIQKYLFVILEAKYWQMKVIQKGIITIIVRTDLLRMPVSAFVLYHSLDLEDWCLVLMTVSLQLGSNYLILDLQGLTHTCFLCLLQIFKHCIGM